MLGELHAILESSQGTSILREIIPFFSEIAIPVISLTIAGLSIFYNNRIVKQNFDNNRKQEIYLEKKKIYIQALKLMNEAFFDEEIYMSVEYFSKIGSALSELQIFAEANLVKIFSDFIVIIQGHKLIVEHEMLKIMEEMLEETTKKREEVSIALLEIKDSINDLHRNAESIKGDFNPEVANEILMKYRNLNNFIDDIVSQSKKRDKEMTEFFTENEDSEYNKIYKELVISNSPSEKLIDILNVMTHEMRSILS